MNHTATAVQELLLFEPFKFIRVCIAFQFSDFSSTIWISTKQLFKNSMLQHHILETHILSIDPQGDHLISFESRSTDINSENWKPRAEERNCEKDQIKQHILYI